MPAIKIDQTDSRFKWIDRTAKWMDSKFTIPGTKIRFGLDPILTFIPGAGDAATLVISGMLVYQMYQHGASRKLIIKMMINVFLDAVIGAIPVIGVIFDTIYKANNRNVNLLKEHYREGKHEGSGTGLIIVIFLGILIVVALLLYLFWIVFAQLWEAIT